MNSGLFCVAFVYSEAAIKASLLASSLLSEGFSPNCFAFAEHAKRVRKFFGVGCTNMVHDRPLALPVRSHHIYDEVRPLVRQLAPLVARHVW